MKKIISMILVLMLVGTLYGCKEEEIQNETQAIVGKNIVGYEPGDEEYEERAKEILPLINSNSYVEQLYKKGNHWSRTMTWSDVPSNRTIVFSEYEYIDEKPRYHEKIVHCGYRSSQTHTNYPGFFYSVIETYYYEDYFYAIEYKGEYVYNKRVRYAPSLKIILLTTTKNPIIFGSLTEYDIKTGDGIGVILKSGDTVIIEQPLVGPFEHPDGSITYKYLGPEQMIIYKNNKITYAKIDSSKIKNSQLTFMNVKYYEDIPVEGYLEISYDYNRPEFNLSSHIVGLMAYEK